MKLIIALLVSTALGLALAKRVWLNPVGALRYFTSESSLTLTEEDFKSHRREPKVSLNLQGNIRRKFSSAAALLQPEKDMICSPISALMPLGKLALGAEGKSLGQLKDAIGYWKDDVGKPFKELIQALRYLPGVTLNIASMVYVSDKLRLREQYITDVTSSFETPVKKIDFSSPSEAADTINKWVSDETKDKIKDIISPSQIDASTSLVLVNAVYFKGDWEYPFERTTDEDFFGTRGKQSKVRMMHAERHYKYGISEELQAKLVEIPYKGGAASLVVVLPLERDGLPILLHKIKLAPELLQDGLRGLWRRRVSLHLPKFRIETTLDLKRLYEYSGAKKIFDAYDSGLTRITEDNKNIFVGEAIQKAFIEVNEQGTEAAAASAVMITMMSGVMEKIETFNADYPFHFFMLTRKEEILFSAIATFMMAPPKIETFTADYPFHFFTLTKGEILFSGIFCGDGSL